jgi:precorrin-6B methylase 2
VPFQPGKDVVWLASNTALVDRMLDMVKLTPEDQLVDLGSGDGILVIRAAQRGARAHGIEYNPDLVALAQRNARTAGVEDRATFVQGDIFESDFSKATVLSLFLTSELNLRLRPKLLAMKPGTRIVSNTFDMLDWSPDISHRRDAGCEDFCTAYAWVVPAQVGGRWQLASGGELQLSQEFQELEGSLTTAEGRQSLRDGEMDGVNIRFTIGGERYTGALKDGVLQGTRGDGAAWRATRPPPKPGLMTIFDVDLQLKPLPARAPPASGRGSRARPARSARRPSAT